MDMGFSSLIRLHYSISPRLRRGFFSERANMKTKKLTPTQIKQQLKELDGWSEHGSEIVKTFKFKDFHGTMKFVNAVAKIANKENHHPDMEVSYNRCVVHYSTHDVGGLSEEDFISATKVDRVFGI
jgi:4a-hydroxytetrahydrobiopterin dehydratase